MQRLMQSCGLRADGHQRHNSLPHSECAPGQVPRSQPYFGELVSLPLASLWRHSAQPCDSQVRYFHTSLLPMARSLETVYPPNLCSRPWSVSVTCAYQKLRPY